MSDETQRQDKTNQANKITKDMILGDVLAKYPQLATVMLEYGLHCVGCMANTWDSIEAGSKIHSMPDEIIDQMVEDMNKVLD